MSNPIEDRVEKKKQARLDEEHPIPKINHAPVKASKFVWMGAAFMVDIATGYAVMQITRWWYAVIWVLAGAGGLVLSEWQRERVGNNIEQKKLGQAGVNVSAVAVVVMALGAGSIYIMGYTNSWGAEIGVLATVVILFCYHAFRSYKYHVEDDEYKAANEDARAEEDHNREIRRIKIAAREAQYATDEQAKVDEHRKIHGGAFDKAYGMPQNASKQAQNQTQKPRGDKDSTNVQQHTLSEFLDISKMTQDQAKNRWKNFDDFAKVASGSFEYISGGNMRRIYAELNPTQAGKNGRH